MRLAFTHRRNDDCIICMREGVPRHSTEPLILQRQQIPQDWSVPDHMTSAAVTNAQPYKQGCCSAMFYAAPVRAACRSAAQFASDSNALQ